MPTLSHAHIAATQGYKTARNDIGQELRADPGRRGAAFTFRELREDFDRMIANNEDVDVLAQQVALMHAQLPSSWTQERKNRTVLDEPNRRDELPLQLATALNLRPKIVALVVFGASPDACDRNNATALHTACANGKARAVHALIEMKANTYAQCAWAETPLAAALSGRANKRVKKEIVQALLFTGAKQRLQNNQPRELANIADQDGVTPLMRAALAGDLDCAELLVRYGAFVCAHQCKNECMKPGVHLPIYDVTRRTARHHAMFADAREIVKFLDRCQSR